MGTQKIIGGDHERYTVGDVALGDVSAEPEVDALGTLNCWMLLKPDEPNERPLDEFLAQAPGTPAARNKTIRSGRIFFMRTM